MDMSKYLGILKWSLQYNDGTSSTDVTEMEEERRKWLREALEEGTVDPAEQMKALIGVLKLPRDETDDGQAKEIEFVDAKVKALVALKDWVESIDWAMDLHKLGGFETLIRLCEDQNEELRVNSMDVFATVVQNNPKPQEWAMEFKALDILVANLSREDKPLGEKEQAKNLLAISSLVRDCPAASIAFVKDHKGILLLVSLLQQESKHKVYEKTQVKALFLMRYFLSEVPVIRAALAEMLVSALANTLKSPNRDMLEHSLHMLELIFSDEHARSRIPDALMDRVLTSVDQIEDNDHLRDLVVSVSSRIKQYSTGKIATPGAENVSAPTNLRVKDE